MKHLYITNYFPKVFSSQNQNKYKVLIYELYHNNNIYVKFLVFLISSKALSPAIFESLLILFNSENLITCGCCNTAIINIKSYYDIIIQNYNDVLTY